MKAYEDLARLRVEEAIRHGMEAQRHGPEGAAVEPPSLAAWTESSILPESRTDRDVRARRGNLRRALEGEWARRADFWFSVRTWLAER